MADDVPALFSAVSDNFSPDVSVSSSATSCSRPPSKPIPTRPCDVAFVQLILMRSGVPARTIIVPNASDRRGGSQTVDVLANPIKDIAGSFARDTTTMDLTVVPFATCSSKKHPWLQITPQEEGVECDAVAGVVTRKAIPLHRQLRSWEGALVSGQKFALWNLLQWFWGAISDDHMGRVDIAVSTCDLRKPGTGTIVGDIALTINLFPIESYSFKLGIPPLWKKESTSSSLTKYADKNKGDGLIDKTVGYRKTTVSTENQFWFSEKEGNSVSTSTQSGDWFGRDVTVTEKHRESVTGDTTAAIDRYSVDGDMGQLRMSKTSGDETLWDRLGIKLQLKRNGSDLDCDLGKIGNDLLKLDEAIKKFRKGLSSAVSGEASIGLTVSGELNVFVIELGATWKRQELAGPRVPWNVEVSISGKLIDASLSAKYGLALKYTCLGRETVNAELSACLKFSGEVAIGKTFNATVLDGQWRWNESEVPLDATLSVSLTGTGRGLVLGQGVQAVAEATEALKLVSKFNPGEGGHPPNLSGDINFTGVSVTVTAYNTISGSQYQSDPIVLVKPCPVVTGFKLPADEEA